LQSREFGTTWTNSGCVFTQDQVGIDGVANTAWTIEDNSAAASESFYLQFTVVNDSATHCASIYVLKDTDTARFPLLQTFFINGTTQLQNTVHLNTQTGAITAVTAEGTSAITVVDSGLWWRVVLAVTNNTTGNNLLRFRVHPADGTVFGTTAVATTGTTIFDQAQLELNTSVPSSPIVTTTAAVTRNADDLSYAASGNLVDAQGTVFCSVAHTSDWTASFGSGRFIGTDSGEALLFQAASNRVGIFDGAVTANGPVEAALTGSKSVQAASRWSGTSMQAASNGNAGTAATYDASFGASSIEVLHRAGSNPLQGTISDIRIYKIAFSTELAESQTEYD